MTATDQAGVLEQLLGSVQQLTVAVNDLTAEILAARQLGLLPMGPKSTPRPVARQQVLPSLLSVAEVALRLNVSSWTAYNLIACGKIAGVVRLGDGGRSGIRVPAPSLEDFIAKGGVGR